MAPLLASLWLGILTSISPCPLGTNIVAISYVGNGVGDPRRVFLGGVLYTMGRMLAYALVGSLVVSSVLSVPDVAGFLQQNMNKMLGPLLVVSGLLVLELVPLRLPGGGVKDYIQSHLGGTGVWGAGLLGLFFALSFCPMSAALFFGSLIPLSIQHGSRVVMPCLYGLGSAVPVLAIAVAIALGSRALGDAYACLARVEVWARRATGVVFLGAGAYYALIYNLGMSI